MSKITKVFFVLLFIGFLPKISVSQNIVITEIMYNHTGSDTLEFVEFYNNSGSPVNMNGYTISDAFEYTFPDTTLGTGEYFVIVKNKEVFETVFSAVMNSTWGGKSPLVWTDSSSLSNSGEDIILQDNNGVQIDSVRYSDEAAWPNADGTGRSLVLCDPNSDNTNPQNWAASTNGGWNLTSLNAGFYYASPGIAEPTCNAVGDIVPPELDEYFIPNNNTIQLIFDKKMSASVLDMNNYSGLAITSINPSTNYDTITITLTNPLTFGQVYNFSLSNAITDSSGNYNNLKDAPFSIQIAFNDNEPQLVITEIMYNNPGPDSLEFIELHYNGLSAIDIGGIKIDKGVDFIFPSNTMIQPDDYIVIYRDTIFAKNYYSITGGFQWKKGTELSNSGEDITLINSAGYMIDSVNYLDTIPWPTVADGVGASLAFCSEGRDNALVENWVATTNSSDYIGTLYVGNQIFATPGEQGITCLNYVTGIEDILGERIELYPNPASDALHISTSTQFNYHIHSLVGSEILKGTSNGDIIISSLSNGVYFISVEIEGVILTKKFIKE